MLAAELVADCVEHPGAVVVPVPQARERSLARGYHPAGRLARQVASRCALPVEPFLARPRGSPRQRGLTHAERRRNVAGAFVAHGAIPHRVLLVDDVYTTGATANAAASALRKAGARRVDVVTFARAIRIR